MNKMIMPIVASLLLTSCATIVSGTSQRIQVRVVDDEKNFLDKASCIVYDNSGGSYALETNPGSVKVSRGNGAITVKCKLKGYKQLNTSVGDSFNAMTVANILFWPGFIIDAASGSYKKYPSHYEVHMTKE